MYTASLGLFSTITQKKVEDNFNSRNEKKKNPTHEYFLNILHVLRVNLEASDRIWKGAII